MASHPCLEDALLQLRKYKGMAERAMEQIDDQAFFWTLDDEANSVALIVKHLAGNMRSRWRDFLTTDGEKPDRGRDREFVLADDDSRESLMQSWEEGWGLCFDAIEPLTAEEAGRTVTIRGEPHTVLEAVHRQLTHYAYHVGQIVLLAKHRAGSAWTSLSIPKGKSADYEVAKRGERYGTR